MIYETTIKTTSARRALSIAMRQGRTHQRPGQVLQATIIEQDGRATRVLVEVWG